MRPRVWAPHAAAVELDWRAARSPMERDGEYWQSPHELAEHDRYRFVLDGNRPMPDPRSMSQPDGVHGASAVVRVERPPLFAPPALEDSVLYELHVGTFSDAGTFAGAIDHLDHLVQLGVTTVEVMPVAEFPGCRGWGYDGVDLYAPHHAYGGAEGLRELVDACHRRGLAVLLDVVYNHLGPDGNYLPAYGPYFTERYRTPWGSAVNLDDHGSAEVRAFILDNARLWLRDYGIDGLRLDAVQTLHDRSGSHILKELATAAHALGGTKLVIAEHEALVPRLVDDYGLDGQWYDDFHHALHAALTGERVGYYRDYGSPERLAQSMSVSDVPRHRLVGFAQNHDQIGNRARGDRLCHLVNETRQRIAAALVILGPFTPLLFMGEEWAASTPFRYFTDHHDAPLAEAVRAGRRREFAAFGWDPADIPDPQAVESFDASKLRWEEREKPAHARMLTFYRELIALRREHPGAVDVRVDANLIEMRRGGVTVRVDLVNDALDLTT